MMFGQNNIVSNPNQSPELVDLVRNASGGLPNFTPQPGSTFGLPAETPFVWGAGGSRLSPDQLALRQKLALQNSQTDYSPIASPWQGLARVAQNVEGALDTKALDKESAAQQSASDQIIAALAGGGAATADKGLVAAALSSPDPRAQALGNSAWKLQNPDPMKNDTVNDYNFRMQTLGPDAANEWLRRGNDPFISVNTPNGFYAGPQSGLGAAMGQTAPTAGVPQAGAVMDGYRFKGGDPSNQANWEQVR